MAMNLKNKSQVTLVATLLAIVLLLVNYIAHRHFIRWDLTEDQEYTLSPSTKKTLAELKDKVTVRLYISANLPMKVCLRVTKDTNSRIILGEGGGEALLGRGDMLCDLGRGIIRCQSPIISQEDFLALMRKGS